MKLTWYGHSCFLLETAEGSAVFDPYAPGSVPGWKLPKLTADCVLCSHGPSDHNWAEGVRRRATASRTWATSGTSSPRRSSPRSGGSTC